MWNKLSMEERNKYIQLALKHNITNLDTIRSSYNEYYKKYFDGGDLGVVVPPSVQAGVAYAATPEDAARNQQVYESYVENPSRDESWAPMRKEIADNIETVLSYTPIVGTVMDGINLLTNPSWENAAYFTVGAASDIFGGRLVSSAARAGYKSAVRTAAKKYVWNNSRTQRAARATIKAGTSTTPYFTLYPTILGVDAGMNYVQNNGGMEEMANKAAKHREENRNKTEELMHKYDAGYRPTNSIEKTIINRELQKRKSQSSK
jgi:hypothetical protein